MPGPAAPRVVAVIPARGGSKRLPRKNLMPLAGIPLVAHAVRAALDATRVDGVYVSTEDGEIAGVARQAGAEVIARPPQLATDTAQGHDVLRHVLEQLGAGGRPPAIAVLLQPTSPLRRGSDIDACLRAFEDTEARSAFSVCAVDHHPGKCVVLKDGLIEPFTNDFDMEARHQDLAPVYRQNGAIYVVGVADFLSGGSLYRRPCAGYVMDRRDSIDIDDLLDLQLAEVVLAARRNPPVS